MRLRILHTTEYRFDDPVRYGLQQLRKTPKNTRAQTVLRWVTDIDGGQRELNFDDFHRNRVELISFAPGTRSLLIRSEGEVELSDVSGVLGAHEGAAPLWLFLRQTVRTKPGSGVRALLRQVPEAPILDRLHALSAAVAQTVRYEIGASAPDWTAEQALDAGAGVCQDHAHVFLSAARALGVPARYVSGYLLMDDRVTQDATHAWVEAHVDGLGWVGFDVSNGISPDERYVRVATGLDYGEAAPVTGSRIGGAAEELSVQVEVAQQ
ncbi:MAG: transglutaminase family protein [Pseudomonadota bacterium]